MRRSLSAAIILIILAFGVTSALAQVPDLNGKMEAHKIVKDEKDREIAMSADEVYPNDTVEYILKYRNTGESPATGVDLVGPIPAGTVYLDQTASDIEGFSPVFSIDGGKTYKHWPVKYEVVKKDGTVEKKTATPDMITHIKWSMSGSFDVGQEVNVSYRVQVK